VGLAHVRGLPLQPPLGFAHLPLHEGKTCARVGSSCIPETRLEVSAASPPPRGGDGQSPEGVEAEGLEHGPSPQGGASPAHRQIGKSKLIIGRTRRQISSLPYQFLPKKYIDRRENYLNDQRKYVFLPVIYIDGREKYISLSLRYINREGKYIFLSLPQLKRHPHFHPPTPAKRTRRRCFGRDETLDRNPIPRREVRGKRPLAYKLPDARPR